MSKTILTPAPQNYKQVVRVAVNNNFNCTSKEYQQLDSIAAAHPDQYFFVNCNIKTPKLLSLNDHPYKAVVTINPDIIVRESELTKLYQIRKDRVAFVRVKYIPGSQPIKDLIQELSTEQYKVVVTIQRYNSKASLLKYSALDDYHFSCNRYRLAGPALDNALALVDNTPNTYACDRRGLGCQGCGLCAKLTAGQDLPIASLNLSSSGICGYNCPDCYAKAMQNFLKGCGQPLIKYDVIKKNKKQAGDTLHIKQNQAALSLV